jgi:hypothetical protein
MDLSQSEDDYPDVQYEQIDVDSSSDPDSGYHSTSDSSVEAKYNHDIGALPDLDDESATDTDSASSSDEGGPPPQPDDADLAWVGTMCRDLVVWKMIDGGLTYKGAIKIVDLVRKWTGKEITRVRRKMLPKTWPQLMRRATTDSGVEKTPTVIVLSCPRRHQVARLLLTLLDSLGLPI